MKSSSDSLFSKVSNQPSIGKRRHLSLDPKEPSFIPNSQLDIPEDLWQARADLTPSEFHKFSNQAQEFALEENLKAASKTPEELVPSYLHKYLDFIFNEEKSQQLPPYHPGFDHKIDLMPSFQPKPAKAYQLALPEREEMDAFIKEHLKSGKIVPSKSPQSSGFFFVGKKDGKLRPCQDYRYLNTHTIKNAYPLPLIPSLINKLRDAKYYTKVDIRWGYNNVRIDPEDRWKAAFTTQSGLYEPVVMFFGMCDSPPTFQALMNHIFHAEIEEGWLVVYMDDILIFSIDLDEHKK